MQHTQPIADLKTYHSVGLRITAVPQAQGQAYYLETAVLDRLHRTCGFEGVTRYGTGAADLVLDLNVTAAGRGGSGWITNANLATIDTLLVLSDAQTGDLLGSARIHGQSSQMAINNNNPEQQAVDVVAQTIGEMLTKSGCTGPRLAKAAPPPPPSGDFGSAPGSGAGSSTATPPPADDHRAEADKLNDQGKDKFRTADLNGALALFQQANQLAPDARYVLNECLAYEAMEKWGDAMATCKQARSMNPSPDLAAKIDHRIDLLKNKQ
ncbi:MAG: hypothetical protein JO257_20525 [Deltaproteobacteria bacterium]|nr:hypothetical protein [Deltaproteobacteria bacterium]